jgi:hypothetical protein
LQLELTERIRKYIPAISGITLFYALAAVFRMLRQAGEDVAWESCDALQMWLKGIFGCINDVNTVDARKIYGKILVRWVRIVFARTEVSKRFSHAADG